jgi:hypothetical protein
MRALARVNAGDLPRETELRDLDRRIAALDLRIAGQTLENLPSRERAKLIAARHSLQAARDHIATRLASTGG